MYYSSVGMISLIIHAIINFEAMRRLRGSNVTPVRLRYRAFLISCMLYYVTDIVWGFTYESRIRFWVFADTTLYFLAISLSLLLWMRFIVTYLNRKTLFNQLLKYMGGGIFLIQALVLVINPFVPVMFRFDNEGEYLPGKARYIILTVQIILFIIISLYTLVSAADKKITHKERLHLMATGLSGLIMSIFIILQTFYPFMPFYALGLLIAVCIIHTYVLMDQKFDWDMELGLAREMAYIDPLTGVKSRTAFIEKKTFVNRQIGDNVMEDFGIVVFDLNDLKKVNDTKGHDAGDKYIKEASHLICDTFKHSPIYRVGGDEFVAFLEGEDFNNRTELMNSFNSMMEDNLRDDNVVISAGIDIYIHDKDTVFDNVFGRADTAMYERKKQLKESK